MDAARPQRLALATALVLLVVIFVGLSAWQVERRAWKHALIAQVEARVSARPVDAPRRDAWSRVDATHDAYRHVGVTGTFLKDRTTFVRAVTALGSGYWVVTPLRRDDDTVVLVDRGFVPGDARADASKVDDRPTTVIGLLRMTEPHGAFLTTNDPAADRWVSRDVQAIAAARGLSDVAPYFIDADAPAGPLAAGVPVGGLTVVAFADNHLLYAVIWALLAALCGVAVLRVLRGTERSGPTTR